MKTDDQVRKQVRISADLIAEQLQQLLPALNGKATLPSVRELCSRFHVSNHTVSRALHLLDKQGFVRLQPRCRARIPSTGDDGAEIQDGHVPPAERIYARVAGMIASGTIPIGQPLPKLTYFAASEYVSNHTVSRAYQRCIREGLAHRKGKSFVAGPAPMPALPGRNRAAIVVLAASPHAWEAICTSPRTTQFGQSFTFEAERNGYAVSTMLTQPYLAHSNALAAGPQEVAAALRRLDTSLAGTLIVGTRREIADIERWVDLIARFGRPIVWFDRADEGLVRDVKYRDFTKCSCTEESQADCALEYLWNMGHRNVLYVYTQAGNWMEERRDFLRNSAQRRGIRMLWRRAFTPDEWESPERSGVLRDLEALHKGTSERLRRDLDYFVKGRKQFLRDFGSLMSGVVPVESPYAGYLLFVKARRNGTPGLARSDVKVSDRIWSALSLAQIFTEQQPPTAVLASNDIVAFGHHLNWLKDTGLSMPDDISLISFDNSRRYKYDSITSVDPGFGSLGYQAFHSIALFMPLRRSKLNEILAHPQVIDRGTVRSLQRSASIGSSIPLHC